MSNPKSFLVACAVSSLFLSIFQMPVQARPSTQSSGVPSGATRLVAQSTSPSVQGSGVTSGAPLTPPFSNPPTPIDSTGTTTTVSPIVQAALDAVAIQTIIPALTSAGGTASVILQILTSPPLSPVAVNILSGASVNSSGNLSLTLPVGNTQYPFPVNVSIGSGATANFTVTNATTGEVISSSLGIPIISLNGTGGSTLNISNNGLNAATVLTIIGSPQPVSLSIASGTANPQAAISAAAAIILVGGTIEQATLAGSLAGASGNIADTLALIESLAGLFTTKISSLPVSTPTSSTQNSSILVASGLDFNSLRTKSTDSAKLFKIAQGSGATVNVEKLSQSITAYNNLLNNSTPEGVVALSKNKEFIVIGNLLRQLRDVTPD